MSIDVMKLVWDKSQHKETNLIAMLALADMANPDGYCWPSHDTLAERCRCNRRNIVYVLERLEASGELYIEHNRGRNRSNRYLITIDTDIKTLADLFVKYFDMPATEAVEDANRHIEKRATERNNVQTTAHLDNVQTAARFSVENVQPDVKNVQPDALKCATACTRSVIEPSLEPKGEYTRETKNAEQPKQPPPSFNRNSPTGDPYMDIALKRQQDRQANNGRHQAKRVSLWPDIDKKVSADIRLPLVERLIDIHGLRAAIDVAEDDAKLADMHKLAADLYVMGFKTLADIEAVYEQFKKEWKGKTPAGRQLVTIASAMKQTDQTTPTKPPPQLLTLKQWCLKTYHVDNPKFANVPEATIHEQYNQYRSQQAH